MERKTNIFRAAFVFRKVIYEKSLFKFYCVCLPLEKLINKKHFMVNKKHFLVKQKFDLVFRKIFSFYFERKTLSGSCEYNFSYGPSFFFNT
jgi:hypothetical protein